MNWENFPELHNPNGYYVSPHSHMQHAGGGLCAPCYLGASLGWNLRRRRHGRFDRRMRACRRGGLLVLLLMVSPSPCVCAPGMLSPLVGQYFWIANIILIICIGLAFKFRDGITWAREHM